MSTKTKRLSQLLFRRSSTNSGGPSKPHYFNQFIGNGYHCDNKEESTDENSCLIPQIVETTPKAYSSSHGRVIFSDKPLRARSSSPSRKNPDANTKLQSILKNGNKNYHTRELREESNSRPIQCGKTTLQRTKSNPNPSIKKSNPVLIPQHNGANSKSANPLQDVSWSCPTLEKRKEMILNYFNNVVLDPNAHDGKVGSNSDNNDGGNETEPIYEEIAERKPLPLISNVSNSNINQNTTDSLKPKITPKKVRLNLPLKNEEHLINESPIYDRLLSRSSSFNVNVFNEWEPHSQAYRGQQFKPQPESLDKEGPFLRIRNTNADSCASSTNPNLVKDIKLRDNNNKVSTKGLADFASEVAQHAKANRSNSFNSFCISSSSSSSSNYEGDYAFAQTCDMDEIYMRLDKRGKKVGTPTTRLLKRHHQNQRQIGKSSPQLHQHQEQLLQQLTSQKIGFEETIFFPKTKEESPKLVSPINSKAIKSNATNRGSTFANETTETTETTDINKSGAISISIGEVVEGGGNESSSSTETESGLSEVPLITSDSSCCPSSSEESESLHQPQLIKPIKPPRATKATKALKTNVYLNTFDTNTSHNFITNVNVDKTLSEKDLSDLESQSQFPQSQTSRNQSGFIDLADVFPHISSTPISPTPVQVLTISVIDSTTSTPKSYPAINNTSTDTRTETEGVRIDKSLKSLTEISVSCLTKENLEDSVIQRNQDSNISHISKQNTPGPLFYTKSGTDDHRQAVDFGGGSNQNNSQEIQKPQENNETMSASVIVTTVQEEANPIPTSGLLIETQNLWDSSSISPSSSSPTSHSSELEESTSKSTASDLSDSSSEIRLTMSDSVVRTIEYTLNKPGDGRNQFIRQDSKYYDDVDEDGGFESFQVVDDPSYRYDDNDDENENAPFSPPSSSASPDILGISSSASNRQRTFAQATQNVPENELKQKASSVLDLINAEISDLHMRELELKQKNRIADGKEDDNESEDMVEGSSQADSDDYSDSAVDVESYSRTSNSSGNVTPADARNRDVSPHSPSSDRGSYHPADADKEAKLDFENEKSVADGPEITLLVKTTSSLIMDIAEIEDDNSGTATVVNKQQQGVKVRPIVEEEVKSIEISLTKETPIEREIRSVREREEEFRRLRSLSSATSVDLDGQTLPSSPVVVANSNLNGNQQKVNKRSFGPTVKSTDGPANFAGPKDIQYEMATARLKREIEENLMKERELFREGRLKSLSVAESSGESVKSDDSNTSMNEETVGSQESVFKPEEKEEDHNILPSAGRRSLVKLSASPTGSVGEVKTSTPTPTGSTSLRFFSPTAFSPVTSPISPITTPQAFAFQPQSPLAQNHQAFSLSPTQSQSLSMNIAKPQFTSIEKMILKGSFSFSKNMIAEEPHRVQEEVRMAKASRMPDPLQIVHRTESVDEAEEGESVEEEKPRKKYVPAQDKIQIELQEQVKREKELSQLRAKWKSTPDLSKSDDKSETEDAMDNAAETREGEGLTKPSVLRRQISSSTQKLNEEVSTNDVLRMNKPTVRRRQSALINQWEEMIKQQQQKNKN